MYRIVYYIFCIKISLIFRLLSKPFIHHYKMLTSQDEFLTTFKSKTNYINLLDTQGLRVYSWSQLMEEHLTLLTMVWAIKICLNYVNKVLTMMEISPQLIFINQHQSHLFLLFIRCASSI